MFKRGWGERGLRKKKDTISWISFSHHKNRSPFRIHCCLVVYIERCGVHLLKTHAVWEQLSRQFIELPETFRNCTLTSIKAPTMQFPYVQATYCLKIEGYFFFVCFYLLTLRYSISNKSHIRQMKNIVLWFCYKSRGGWVGRPSPLVHLSSRSQCCAVSKEPEKLNIWDQLEIKNTEQKNQKIVYVYIYTDNSTRGWVALKLNKYEIM